MVPLYHAHLYHCIAPIRALRNTPRNVVATRYNKGEYLVSCICRRFCLQQEAIEAWQTCAMKLCNGDRNVSGDITHSKVTLAQILDPKSITIHNRDCDGETRRGFMLIQGEGCNSMACHDTSFFLT